MERGGFFHLQHLATTTFDCYPCPDHQRPENTIPTTVAAEFQICVSFIMHSTCICGMQRMQRIEEHWIRLCRPRRNCALSIHDKTRELQQWPHKEHKTEYPFPLPLSNLSFSGLCETLCEIVWQQQQQQQQQLCCAVLENPLRYDIQVGMNNLTRGTSQVYRRQQAIPSHRKTRWLLGWSTQHW